MRKFYREAFFSSRVGHRLARFSVFALLALSLALLPTLAAQGKKKARPKGENKASSLPAVLWREPADITTRDLFYGQGGKEHEPTGAFKFLEEDMSGTNPKFRIEDSRGVQWKVKLGVEARPETVAAHFVWAVGYFADEDYYLPTLHVEGMRPLKRGRELVSADGTVQGGVRLERHIKGEKNIGRWSWFKNPFVGTKELDGLKVMMALINNTDLKEDNNSIYDEQGTELRYVVSDLGASFGKTGHILSQSIGKVDDYVASRFIRRAQPEYVDFVMHSRPPFFFLFNVRYYLRRSREEKIVRHIPREHARWLGQLLAKLSNEQIQSAFRGGGYSPEETAKFTKKMRERIAELNSL